LNYSTTRRDEKNRKGNKQTNKQPEKNNNNNKKKEEELMLVLYMYCGSISFSSCCNGRQGILQISFNLIMASLGSRQTVFSSSFVFIFIFFFSKKNKKTQ
jgi:hypothetical protein